MRTPQRNEKQKRNNKKSKIPGEDEGERVCEARAGSWILGAGVGGGASVRRKVYITYQCIQWQYSFSVQGSIDYCLMLCNTAPYSMLD